MPITFKRKNCRFKKIYSIFNKIMIKYAEIILEIYNKLNLLFIYEYCFVLVLPLVDAKLDWIFVIQIVLHNLVLSFIAHHLSPHLVIKLLSK